MSTVLPDPSSIPLKTEGNTQLIEHLLRLNESLAKEFERYVAKTTAVSAIYLQSNGGYVYEITVDDAGTLTTTLKYQP